MRPISELSQDLRYAARQLRRTPGFTAVAVLTLALGVGAHTAFFAVVNALAFTPIGGINAEAVSQVRAIHAGGGRSLFMSLDGVRALERDLPDGVLSVGAIGPLHRWTVVGGGRAEALIIDAVSGGFADTFGLRAQHGRWLRPEDDLDRTPQRVAVISDRLWREWFHADPEIVGRASVRLYKTPLRIVGVAAPDFAGLGVTIVQGTDLWVPLSDWITGSTWDSRMILASGFRVFLRARTPLSTPALEGGLHAILASRPVPELARPGATPAKGPEAIAHQVVPAVEALVTEEATRIGIILLSLSGLVLLAASANFANLLYARNAARAGDVAIRLSLGAGRWRAIRQLVVEAAVIGMLAGACGLVLGIGAISAFQRSFPALEIVRYERVVLDVNLDWLVVLSALGVGVVTAVLVSLAAAWRTTHVQPGTLTSSSGTTSSTTRRGRLSTAMVAVQVTAAVLLVMVAGLFIEDVRNQLSRRLHIHYDAGPLSAARVNLNLHEVAEAHGKIFFDRWLAEVRRLPDVERAALSDGVPGTESASYARTTIIAEGGPQMSGEPPRIEGGFTRISPGFFETLGLRLRAGRDFGPGDADGAPGVAILSENAADALWPGQDPVGKRLVVDRRPVTVIGIAPNLVSGLSGRRETFPASERLPATRPSNYMFVPFAQHYRPSMFAIVRSPTSAQLDALRLAALRVDPDVAVTGAATVPTLLSWQDALWAAASVLFGIAAVALTIAMLGVYGVVSFFVSTRTREFGIRLALGATPRRLMKLVFDYSLHVVIVGLLPAVFLAAVTSRLIESRRFDLMPNEISTWVIVPLLLVAAGVVAGFVPARRAARTNPTVSLRQL